MLKSGHGGVASYTNVQLRNVELGDLPFLFRMESDPEAHRMAVVIPRDEASFYAHWAEVLADPTLIAKVILLEGRVVGDVSCFTMDGRDCVGYWIAREHWGKGIATQALRLLLQEVTTRPLHARVAATNLGSLRVLERCGFVVTGYEFAPATPRFPACNEACLVLT
jgi:RimJ/RimL family protein N-acetyltransferase